MKMKLRVCNFVGLIISLSVSIGTPPPAQCQRADGTITLDEWQKLQKTHVAAQDNVVEAGNLTWHTNFQDAEKLAAQESKMIFVFFFANWCGQCKHSDEVTFRDPQVVQKLNDKFICVRADVNSSDYESIINELQIHGVPAMAIFSANGTKLAVFDRYRSPALLISTIDQALNQIPTLKPGKMLRVSED